ncbi:response regulator [Halalkalibacter alkalisediminis]|uniref:Response regulator n=1 Tax=Halalkalibacter alkalisediminis TaxID=935616 RepID=A0ABV6NIY5_9BACI|nr:response regulator [Halalkalibacter alkalisediminis]
MKEIYQVLIVEDDFRVAEITRQFVEKISGFDVLAICKTGAETEHFLKHNQTPDLILLDVYIPDVEGLDLFWTIRKNYHQMEIIMITAAKEVLTIEETLRGGTFDYIVKPVEFQRFEQTLQRYQKHRQMLTVKREMDQEEIDRLRGLGSPVSTLSNQTDDLPKGIDRLTLEKIQAIMQKKETGVTAIELGKEIGASRSTARRYLEYLVSAKKIEAALKYGDVGRPERRYTWL